MANAHITATLRCSKFKGTTRLVLLYLADAASPGPKIVEKKKTGLPLGYCKRRLSTIMAAVNSKRQPTVSAAISELKREGAIKQFPKKKDGAWQVPLYFVDLEWLKAHAYTDEELEQFGYKSLIDKREEEKQAEKNSTDHPDNLDADDLFPNEMVFKGKTPVSHASATGKGPPEPLESTDTNPMAVLVPPYPLATGVSPAEQLKPFNADDGNRLKLNTESVRPGYENRLTDFPPVPTPALRLGDFDPPSDDGSVPTASRDNASRSRHSLRSHEQHQDQEQQQQHPSLPAAKVDPPVPVHSSATSDLGNSAAPRQGAHYWPGEGRTEDTPCKYCGSPYRDRYDQEPCV